MADEDNIDLTSVDLKTGDALPPDGEVRDEAVKHEPSNLDKGQEDKPQRISIRDSIKQAVEQVNEKDKKEQELKATLSDKNTEDKPVQKTVSSEQKETHDDKDEGKEVTPTSSDIKPPVSWSKEAKESWNTLPPAIQNAVLKREKEFSDGIKQYADDAKKIRELEPYFAPHRQSMAANGINEVQVVGKLFDWFNNLSHSDPNHRAMAFRALAQSFGIDLARVFPQKTGETVDKKEFDGKEVAQSPDLTQHPVIQQLYGAVQQMHTQQIEQQRQAAYSYVAEWAKDKPHFERVRETMRSILASGVLPLKNGQLDLDAAYEKAIRLDDELFRQIEEERIAKEAEQKAKDLAKKELQKQHNLQSKRNAAASLKPGAPSPGTSSSLNGSKPKKKMSVRDSIIAAMSEVRGN